MQNKLKSRRIDKRLRKSKKSVEELKSLINDNEFMNSDEFKPEVNKKKMSDIKQLLELGDVEVDQSILDKVEAYLEKQKSKIDTDGNGEIEPAEWKAGAKKVGKIVLATLIKFLACFLAVSAIIAIKDIEVLKQVIIDGEVTWEWIWANIVSIGISGAWSMVKESFDYKKEKLEVERDDAVNSQKNIEQQRLDEAHSHEIEMQHEKATAEINLAYERLQHKQDISEQQISKYASDAIARVEIAKNEKLQSEMNK